MMRRTITQLAATNVHHGQSVTWQRRLMSVLEEKTRATTQVILCTLFLILGWLFITQTAIAQEPTPPILFSGTVVDDLGRALPEAQVQFWQTDAYGYYNHPAAPNTALRDPNFQFFGTATTDSSGNFAFKTLQPGLYPGRPSHIHFKVWLGGVELLTSQFYFADENVAVSELLILDLVESTDSDGTRAFLTSKNITINMGGGGSLPITPAQTEGPFYPVVDFFGYDNDLTTIEIPSAVTIRQQQTATSHTLLLISFLGLLFIGLSLLAVNQKNRSLLCWQPRQRRSKHDCDGR